MVNARGRARHGLSHARGAYIYTTQKTLKISNNNHQMNMISHLIEKYIDNDEQKLALKISIASFVIFITILTLII